MSKNGILRTLRLEKRFSKEELCEIFNKEYDLKINRNMISKWESGQITPTGIYLSAYARYFNISSGYIASLIESRQEEDNGSDLNETTEEINIVKRLREEQGFSQEQLAELTGYKTKKKIEEIEEGISFIPESKISKFVKVLKTSKEILCQSISEGKKKDTNKKFLKPDVILEDGKELYFDIINIGKIAFHYYENNEEKKLELTNKELNEFNKSMNIVNILFDSPYITKTDKFGLKREALKCYIKNLMSFSRNN